MGTSVSSETLACLHGLAADVDAAAEEEVAGEADGCCAAEEHVQNLRL